MTVYNPIKDTGPTPGAVQNDATAYDFGLLFTVTAPCYLNGVWWYCGTGQYTNSNADEEIALWIATGQITGTFVAGSATTAPTYTQGAWNFIPYSSPIALSAGTEYCAVKGISSAISSHCYTAVTNFFEGGQPGGAGFSEGPGLVYSSGKTGSTGSSNLDPYGLGQQCFYTGAGNSIPPDVTARFPNSSFGGSWYGMDVQIATTPAPSGSGLLMASFP